MLVSKNIGHSSFGNNVLGCLSLTTLLNVKCSSNLLCRNIILFHLSNLRRGRKQTGTATNEAYLQRKDAWTELLSEKKALARAALRYLDGYDTATYRAWKGTKREVENVTSCAGFRSAQRR